MNRLTAIGVRNARPGRHSDGGGLYLYVKPSGARSWLLRVQSDGKRRDIGLGSVEMIARGGNHLIDIPLLHKRTLTLAEARDKCALLRKAAQAGLDPVLERDRDRHGIPTFEQATEATFADLKGNWKPRQQHAFLSSMRRHAFPGLGKRRVDQIEAVDIQEVLKPIWSDKVDIGRKVNQRIALVLNFSHAKGWRKTETPSKAIATGLPKRTKLPGNYSAMHFEAVARFVAILQNRDVTVGRLALLFTIYTAARSGEVRNARWSQIDFAQKLWKRPGDMMKNGKAHNITLSNAALTLIKRAEQLRRDGGDDIIFPSSKNTPLSDATLSKIVRVEGEPYTVHGFRSSFRDWAAEKMTHIPDAVAEVALAHSLPDKVMAAYKRTTFEEMRRQLTTGWADWLESKPGDTLIVQSGLTANPDSSIES